MMNEPIKDKNGRYNYVYKITNKVNNKIYIGKHSTYNLDDGYMSSSPYLWNSIRKHGIKNFTKEILQFCSSSKEAYEVEESLVTKEFCERSDTYNLITGGKGFDSEDMTRINTKRWNDPEYRDKTIARLTSEKHRKAMLSGQQRSLKENREKYCRRINEIWKNPEVRERHHNSLIESWKNPERIAAASKAKIEFWSNPENKSKISAKNRKFWEDHPEARAELSRKISEALNKPETRLKHSESLKEARRRPEVKERYSSASKKLWEDPEYREKVKNGKLAKQTEESREFQRLVRVIINYFISCKRAFGHNKPWMESRYSKNFWSNYYLMKKINKDWLLTKIRKERSIND